MDIEISLVSQNFNGILNLIVTFLFKDEMSFI